MEQRIVAAERVGRKKEAKKGTKKVDVLTALAPDGTHNNAKNNPQVNGWIYSGCCEQGRICVNISQGHNRANKVPAPPGSFLEIVKGVWNRLRYAREGPVCPWPSD